MNVNIRLYIILGIFCTLAPSIARATPPEGAAFIDEDGNYYDKHRNFIVLKDPRPPLALNPIDNRKDSFNTGKNARNKNKQNKKEAPLVYHGSVYDSQGPRQGKMAIGGVMSQVAANVLGNIGALNKDRNLMTAAYGLQGMGEMLSRVNDRRDPWGRSPGNPEYGINPRTLTPNQFYGRKGNGQNMNGQQQHNGWNRGPQASYGENNYYRNQNSQNVPNNMQPPVNPVPAVVPNQQSVNRTPGKIRINNQPVPNTNPTDNLNKEKGNKAQEATESLI